MKRLIIALLFALPMGILTATAVAQDIEVDVELFLAVDVSHSMTERELEIQRRGYAEALASEDVVKAIGSGLIGRIAVTYVEWAGRHSQRVIVDWSVIGNREDAERFAEQLTARFNPALRRTSISGALDYASLSFNQNGFITNRRIIDVSGDGPNNDGRPVLEARAETVAAGIVINGLPLMTREGMGSQWHLEDLDEYYRNCVIGGPASFVIPVLKWEHFPAAVRLKLIQELAHQPTLRVPITKAATGPVYDCLVGEKIWQQFRRDWLEP